jgi:O-antigen/teichoic acid export membrane protein
VLASQRWALAIFATTADVGYFSAIFQIGFAPFMLGGGTIMTLLTPILFARAGDGSDKQKVKLVGRAIVKFCTVAFFLVLLATVAGVCFHDMIFRLLVAEQYRPFAYYLPFAILAGGVLQVSLFLSTVILTSTKTRLFLPINIIGSCMIAGINLIMTWAWGVNGLFFAMIVGSFLHLIWNICNVRKLLNDI